MSGVWYISSYNPVCHREKKFVTCSKFQTSQDTVATCVIIFCCPKTGLGGDWRLSDRPRSPGGLILRVASITLKCHSGSSDHFCILTYLCKGTGQYWSLICSQWVISTCCNVLLGRNCRPVVFPVRDNVINTCPWY